jgi:hypothetical protein
MHWAVEVPAGGSAIVHFDVYKKFIPMSKFGFAFEKGFDLASAVYRVADDVFFTRGLVTIIPLPDHTSTFNVLAVAVTTIALFFSMFYRNFGGKRSELVDSAAAPDRDPPLFRLIKWLVKRLHTAAARLRWLAAEAKLLAREVEEFRDS